MAKAVIENVVDIDRAPADVFDYASDHRHEMEWNPKMRGIRKLTEGPVRKGTRFEMEFIPGRRVVTTYAEFERPDRWQVAGNTLGMHITLGGKVTPTPAGSRLTLRTEFQAEGPLALALPLVRRRMAGDMQRDVERIRDILESQPAR